MAAWSFRLTLLLCIAVLYTNLETAQAQSDLCNRPIPCRQGDILPDPENCRKYYECNPGGRWKNPSCKSRMNFDSVQLECMNQQNARCATGCGEAAPIERDPCSPPALPCIPGSVDQNFKNCSTFYLCDGAGEWTVEPCLNSQKYHPERQNCVSTDESPCEETCILIDEPIDLPDFPFPPAPTDPPVITPIPVTPYDPISTISETVIELACDRNADCQIGNLLPDPQDCTKFFMCVPPGFRAVQTCEFELRFDAITLQCQDSSRAICMPSCDSFRNTTKAVDTNTPAPQKTTAVVQTNTPPRGIIGAMLALACNLPQFCLGLDAVPVPGNCSAFYWCDIVTRTYEVRLCPSAQQFDIINRRCEASGATCMPALTCSPRDSTQPVNEKTTKVPITTSTAPAVNPTTDPSPTTSTAKPPSGPTDPVLPPIIPSTFIPENVTLPSLTSKPAATVVPPKPESSERTISTDVITTVPSTVKQDTTSAESVSSVMSTMNNEVSTVQAKDPNLVPETTTEKASTDTSATTEKLSFTTTSLGMTTILQESTDSPRTEAESRTQSETTEAQSEFTTYQETTTEEEAEKTTRTTPEPTTYVEVTAHEEPDTTRTTPEPTTYVEVTTQYQSTTEAGKSSTEDIMNITEAADKTLTTEKTTTTPSSITICESSVDSNGLKWASAIVGQTRELPCPSSQKGSVIRQCILGVNGLPVWEKPVSFCVDPQYVEILILTQTILPGNNISMQMTEKISKKLQNIILADMSTNKELSVGNLNASLEAVLTLSKIRVYGAGTDLDTVFVIMENTANSLDTLLSLNNTRSWKAIIKQNQDSPTKIMNATDDMGRGIANALPQGSSKNISLENFVIQAVSLPKNQTTAVSFSVDVSEGAPLLQLNYSSIDSSTVLDSIEVQPATLRVMAENAGTENLVMWTTYHSRLDMLMPATKNMIINSRILALTVENLQTGFTFHPPITMRFTPLNKTLAINETFCSFWKYTSRTSGYWSQDGCYLKSNNTNITVCECNHLTNFAVLVSPYLADGIHARILSLISLVGCLLSILGCFATMVFYMLAWKEVKSQHATVLLNLCAVLIIANVIFLVGIDKVRLELVCTIVAALLHYFWLVAFMVMLADGVMFILYVVYVFHVKRRREIVLLLLTAWLVPAVIVGVTLGVTRTKGYGTKEYCWLERTSGLIAAFIAPVGVIILANFVVLIKVLHTAATSKSNEHKNRSRVVAVVWNIMVVLPLLGIAWIFGLLSVNEQTIAFQYVFAIANSLQGLFIFLFHCVLNKKVRNGVSSRFSIKSSSTSSLKSNKSNKSANLRNATNKNNNGFMNRKAQEEKVL